MITKLKPLFLIGYTIICTQKIKKLNNYRDQLTKRWALLFSQKLILHIKQIT